MNIRRFSNALIFGMAVLMVLLITLVWLTFETSKQAATAERLRHESYALATEMKHSLDQLMIMVRLYSNRNMPQYEEYFQRILAIRDGKVPRPANYSEFYWDYVLGRPGYSQPAGETVSLEELMRRQRFTDAEFALLDEAHRRAAGLARIEQQAFAAMKGLFIDERGELIGQGEPDPALARRLLNSDEYLAQRAHIMEPLDTFIRSVESRTRRELDELQRAQAMYVRFALALTLIGAALGVPVALYTLRRIVRPIDRLVEHANHIATRNYDSRNTVAGDDELGILGTTLNTMSAAIECDIDARREVERELADQLHFQAQLLDAIPNPIYFKDTIGRYLGCNRAYEEAFGVTREYMRGRTVFDLEFVPEQLRRQYQDQTLDIVRDGGLHYREAALRYADGTSHTVMYWLAAFDLMDGRRGGVIGVLVDFTRHKQMERALGEARDVAEAATQAKASFLAAMSHEIRTPMNGIIGMIDLLNQTRMEPDQMHMLGTVRDSAFALLTIINDILDFSKIESGRLELESIPISLRDAVEGVADTLAPNARKRGIQFATFIDPSLPRRVLGDQVRLRQILFNLAGNAIKFTEDKAERRGRVEIRAESVGSEAGGVRVRFTIVDNGIGIDRDKLPELFQPFTQAEQSTTRRFGGSGLGLSICKRLAEMMGGTVGVDSVKGQGSTFWAELPFAGVEDQSDGVETEDLNGLYVHVVTTDPAECQILMRYLRHWGAAVVTIDGDDPVAAVHSTSAKRAPDVIVIGEQPGSGDMALYERLCSHPLLARTRYVVLCTDRGDRQLATPDRVIVETNPMRRSSLVRGVAIAGGRASPEIPRTEELAADREEYERSRAEASRHRILVAEDNVTNQDVIRRQLDRLGYPCDVVGNGVEALDALHRGGYAVLLTDCHMPEMDGYDLARNIRIGERGQPIRLPIVAITANALKGEAERCLEAGMDDYLSKPLEMEKLKRMLRKWTAGHDVLEAQATVERSVELPPAPAPDSAELPAVDPAALQEVFGDDAATFKEILSGFASASPPIVAEIESAAQAGDAVAAGSAAHKLKSAARAVGAHPLADLSYRIEQAGRSGDLHEVQAGVATLQSTMHAVLKYIAAL